MCSGISVGCYWEHFYFNFLGNRGLLFEVWDDASDLTEAGPGYRWQFVPNASSPVRFLSGAKKSFRYSVILKRDEATAFTCSGVRCSNTTWQVFIAEPYFIASINQSRPSVSRSFWSSKYAGKGFIFPPFSLNQYFCSPWPRCGEISQKELLRRWKELQSEAVLGALDRCGGPDGPDPQLMLAAGVNEINWFAPRCEYIWTVLVLIVSSDTPL